MKDKKELLEGAINDGSDLELFEYLLEEEEIESPAGHSIPRREEAGPVPLSFAQQRLWFLEQMEPGSPTYNISGALRLKGVLNVDHLSRSLNEIIRRHEALRTTFTTIDTTPVQVIHPSLSLAVPVEDLGALPESEREARAKQIAAEQAREPFDLERGPLFRASLLRLSSQQHVLLLSVHHIICDGWSISIIISELASFYLAFSIRSLPSLPLLLLQYPDYALWQRQWLQAGALSRQLNYWTHQLAGLNPVITLPLDKPRPPVQTFTGASIEHRIGSRVATALKQITRAESATLFMGLLSAYAILLSRYSDQQEVVIGTPVANRTRSEVEGTVGLFVNTLVMRVSVRAEQSYRGLLREVREVALGAYNHQDLPFEKLVEELRPERDLSHSPLFQVAFALQNAPLPPIELPGLSLKPLEVDSEMAKFDLTLSIEETQQGLHAVLQYNTDLFEDATARRMLKHYEVLLEAIVADPDRPLSELPILAQTERQQILEEWNDTERNYPKESNLNRLLQDQAERVPEAVAVSFQDAHLSYRELNRQANQIAHHLQSLGVGRGSLVGDRKSTRLNSSHMPKSRMPSSA